MIVYSINVWRRYKQNSDNITFLSHREMLDKFYSWGFMEWNGVAILTHKNLCSTIFVIDKMADILK